MSDERFSRLGILIGEAACERLRSAKILVCGLGAVGGMAVEILARCGVGSFVLADCDCFEISNINRQICALESTLGKPKVEVQKARILDINPKACVNTFHGFIDEGTIPQLLAEKPDIVVDAIDSISSKVSLIKGAILSDIKIVSSMGAARRRDAGLIKTASLKKSHGCPMASEVRKRLRAQGVDLSACECVFSDEQPSKDSHFTGEASAKILGSSPVITAIFGVRLADLAISNLLKDAVR